MHLCTYCKFLFVVAEDEMMKLQEAFRVVVHEQENFISLVEFIKHLQQNKKDEDTVKEIRTSNVERVFQKYKEKIVVLHGEKYAPVISVLKYIFHSADSLHSCKVLALAITNQVCNEKEKVKNEENTVFDLYQKVAKTSFETHLIYKHLSQHIDIDDKEIPSLYSVHKGFFTEEEWKKICVFELQFSSTVQTDGLSFESSVKSKWQYFQACEEAKKVARDIHQHSLNTIKRRNQRKAKAQLLEDIHVHAAKRHIPSTIEDQLMKSLAISYPAELKKCQIICVDREYSKIDNGLDIYIQCLTDLDMPIQIPIAKSVHRLVQQKHKVSKVDIFFFKPGSFDNNNTDPDRFRIRDEVLQGDYESLELGEHVLTLAESENEDDDDDDEEEGRDDLCPECYGTAISSLKPLHVKSFDVHKEWWIDVPLPVQLILEPFINDKSLRTTTANDFIEGKLERLYGCYDVLLNVLNKQYHGIQQEATTAQLTLNYRSVSSLFQLTSAAGASQSWSKAERSLQERSTKSNMYFQGFLKPYTLTYDTDAGTVTQQVRMRDTYCVIRIDNLVRLKFNNDPSPGESRSKQMCSLPVSVEGIPKDAAIVQTWHDPAICEGPDAPTCSCKKSVKLEKHDVDKVLFTLSSEEQLAKAKFNRLCNWGILAYMTPILEDSTYSHTSLYFIYILY